MMDMIEQVDSTRGHQTTTSNKTLGVVYVSIVEPQTFTYVIPPSRTVGVPLIYWSF